MLVFTSLVVCHPVSADLTLIHANLPILPPEPAIHCGGVVRSVQVFFVNAFVHQT
jgi:hypothetical protein